MSAYYYELLIILVVDFLFIISYMTSLQVYEFMPYDISLSVSHHLKLLQVYHCMT